MGLDLGAEADDLLVDFRSWGGRLLFFSGAWVASAEASGKFMDGRLGLVMMGLGELFEVGWLCLRDESLAGIAA